MVTTLTWTHVCHIDMWCMVQRKYILGANI